MVVDGMLMSAGAATGLLVGLTGVGGGALMTPLLLLMFGMAPLAAIGTDLWFAAIMKIFASRVHQAHGLVDWQVARRLWTGSLSASAITMLLMQVWPPQEQTTDWLKAGIAVAVVLTAAGMLLQRSLHQLGRRLRIDHGEQFKAWQAPLTVLAGALIGTLVTLTSVGAGALGAVLLSYLYPLRLTMPRLIATDIVHAIPLAMFAGMGHLWAGHVQWGLLANLLAGAVPAVIAGALLSSRLPGTLLRTALAMVLLAVGGKLAWSIWA